MVRTVRNCAPATALAGIVACGALPGCHAIPIAGDVRADANVTGNLRGTVDVHVPSTPDPGPIVASVVRAAPTGAAAPRVALIDIDGLLVNQNLTGIYSQGENPVAVFREKLEAAAADARVRAVVLRINSPGGGVAATDLMAEELRRFRSITNKPVVSCLMDVAAGGAYYLAVGGDVVVAQPTGVVGGIGALINHVNLEDAMAQFNVRVEAIKAGEMIDMGTVTAPLTDEARKLLREMADGYRNRFLDRVFRARPAMSARDRAAVDDGRILPATKAAGLHLVDRLGYLDDAIGEAERLAGACGAEVVMFHRADAPPHSIYAIAPNTPLQGELIPFNYPGLDRNKLPTFLYLWQPDPTIARVPGH